MINKPSTENVLLADIATPTMTKEMCDMFKLLLQRSHVPLSMQVRFCMNGGPISKLSDCDYIGAGTDGMVFTQTYTTPQRTTGVHVIKVREILSYSQLRALGREVAMNHFLGSFNLPFVSRLVSCKIWQGEKSSMTTGEVSPYINLKINRNPGDLNYAIDIVEHMMKKKTRHSAYAGWCMANRLSCPATYPGHVAVSATPVESYIKMRSEFLENCPEPQIYAVLTQEHCGDLTLAAVLERGWFSASRYRTVKYLFHFIIHEIHTLQELFYGMHNDLHPANILLKKITDIPTDCRPFWSPIPEHNSTTRITPTPIRVDDCEGYMPTLIDFTLFTAEPDVIRSRLGIGPSRLEIVNAILRRSYQFSRESDMRRIGMFSTGILCAAIQKICSDQSRDRRLRGNDQHAVDLFSREVLYLVDYRFVILTIGLTAIKREWLQLALTPAGCFKFEDVARHMSSRKTIFLKTFIGNLIVVQQFLHAILRMTHPATYRCDHTAAVVLLKTTVMRVRTILDDSVFDLNPFSDYIQTCGVSEDPNGPHVPAQMLRWGVWMLPQLVAAQR